MVGSGKSRFAAEGPIRAAFDSKFASIVPEGFRGRMQACVKAGRMLRLDMRQVVPLLSHVGPLKYGRYSSAQVNRGVSHGFSSNKFLRSLLSCVVLGLLVLGAVIKSLDGEFIPHPSQEDARLRVPPAAAIDLFYNRFPVLEQALHKLSGLSQDQPITSISLEQAVNLFEKCLCSRPDAVPEGKKVWFVHFDEIQVRYIFFQFRRVLVFALTSVSSALAE